LFLHFFFEIWIILPTIWFLERIIRLYYEKVIKDEDEDGGGESSPITERLTKPAKKAKR